MFDPSLWRFSNVIVSNEGLSDYGAYFWLLMLTNLNIGLFAFEEYDKLW